MPKLGCIGIKLPIREVWLEAYHLHGSSWSEIKKFLQIDRLAPSVRVWLVPPASERLLNLDSKVRTMGNIDNSGGRCGIG